VHIIGDTHQHTSVKGECDIEEQFAHIKLQYNNIDNTHIDMVRKNKGKKKKSGGGRTKAPTLNNDDSSLIRITNVWPRLDEIGRWTCTNCKSLNSMITGAEPGGCYDCGHSELDEKFAVLIIPILVKLHDAGLANRINLRLRSTWKLEVVQDAQEVLHASHLDYDVSIDNQFRQLHLLIKVRSLIYEYEEDSGLDEPERVALAVEMIMVCQNEEYMEEIRKTTEFHTLVDCIQHYQNQMSEVESSISSKDDDEVSHITDDEKLGSNTEENTKQQPVIQSPQNEKDIDTRLINHYIDPLLNEIKEVVILKSTDTLTNEAGILLVRDKLESDDITFNPRTVIQAQLQYVQLTNDHSLDNYFGSLRELVNVRSILKSDGIQMAAAKLEEASHKQHMREIISDKSPFQSLLSDMSGLVIEDNIINNSNSWQSHNDMHHRREMIHNILINLRERKLKAPQEFLMKELPQMAKRLESLLYLSDPSLEAYLDTTTLDARLNETDIRTESNSDGITLSYSGEVKSDVPRVSSQSTVGQQAEDQRHGQQSLKDAHGSDHGHGQQAKLTLETLALAKTPDARKKMIGQRLFPLILKTHELDLACKIADKLLESDNYEFLLHLLESPEALSSSIQEILHLLEPDSDIETESDSDMEDTESDSDEEDTDGNEEGQEQQKKKFHLTDEMKVALREACFSAIRHPQGTVDPELLQKCIAEGLPEKAVLNAAVVARQRQRDAQKRGQTLDATARINNTNNNTDGDDINQNYR